MNEELAFIPEKGAFSADSPTFHPIFARQPMRDIINPNHELGGIDIMAIEIDHNSRDDMPAALLGWQTLYGGPQVRKRLFARLETEALPGVDLNNGRPGMAAVGGAGDGVGQAGVELRI